MKKILIATHNPAKLKEIKFGLRNLENLKVKLISLNDVRVEEEAEETGKTFQENSELKAKFYSKLSGLPTVADDGGLVIPYLKNNPGVKSRRWLGYKASDEELINYTLLNLKGVKLSERTAYLETCVVFFDPKTNKFLFEQEKIKGRIAEKPSRKPTNGYPFRALFIVDKFNKYYDELTRKENEQINHRLKALKRLTNNLSSML